MCSLVSVRFETQKEVAICLQVTLGDVEVNDVMKVKMLGTCLAYFHLEQHVRNLLVSQDRSLYMHD